MYTQQHKATSKQCNKSTKRKLQSACAAAGAGVGASADADTVADAGAGAVDATVLCLCVLLLAAVAAVAFAAGAAAGVRGCCLLVGDDKLLVVDLSCDFAGVGAVDGAANGEASAKDLLHAACQCAGKAAWAHGACNVNDCVQGQVAVVHS